MSQGFAAERLWFREPFVILKVLPGPGSKCQESEGLDPANSSSTPSITFIPAPSREMPELTCAYILHNLNRTPLMSRALASPCLFTIRPRSAEHSRGTCPSAFTRKRVEPDSELTGAQSECRSNESHKTTVFLESQRQDGDIVFKQVCL